MKKVLIATTALIATAGMAAADVKFGGYARFGLLYSENATNETSITSRFRLQIDTSAESDGGVQFGARVRIQQDDDGAATEGALGTTASSPSGTYRADRTETGINGVRFYARAAGFEVGVGNIFGALEFMGGQYPIDMGLTGLGYAYTAYAGGGSAYNSDTSGGAGQGAIEVMYSAGAFGIHLSYEQGPGRGAGGSDAERFAGHIEYTWNDWSFQLGAQDSNIATDTEWTAAVQGSLGIADVGVTYADNGTRGDHWVVWGRFDVGAATNIEAYVADADAFTDTSYGIDFNHSLGGGTSLRGGVVMLGNGNTQADLGVRFNF